MRDCSTLPHRAYLELAPVSLVRQLHRRPRLGTGPPQQYRLLLISLLIRLCGQPLSGARSRACRSLLRELVVCGNFDIVWDLFGRVSRPLFDRPKRAA